MGWMINSGVSGVVWTYAYSAENQLVEIRKNNQVVSTYGFDGDGKRVWARDYDGYLPDRPKVTTYVGNHYEVRVEGYVQPSPGGSGQPCSAPLYCSYLPLVANTIIEKVSYYYADGQRIAMRNNGVVSYLYGDQLGSVSAVARADGSLLSKTFYHPWGTTRYSQGTTPTDYAFTGQMKEGDIYFYNARWYDPQLGRFMQADAIVPPTQGIQGFDRYAYVNNNPLRFTDPSGMWFCGDWYDEGCIETYSERSSYARMYTRTTGRPYEYYVTGSYDFGLGKVKEIDHSQDDVSSMSPSFVPRGMAWWVSLLDLGVRLFGEFKPQPPYVAKDDLFWRVHVRNNPDYFELLSIDFWSPKETIGISTIDYSTPEQKLTQSVISEVIRPNNPATINLNAKFEALFVDLLIQVSCYGCMTGTPYKDLWVPSVTNSPRFTIHHLR
jgi:RHS repeat-associated protein